MKILTTIIAIFVCFGFVTGFAVQKENVVLLYHFDSDTKDEAEDASAQKHTGEVTDATWMKDGKFGGGMEFNGKSSVIEVPHHPSLQPGGDKLTVAAWYKPSSFPGGHPPIARKGSVAESGWGFDTPGGKPRGFIYTAVGNATVAQGASTLTVNAWQHLAMVYDGKEIRVYLDGKLDGKPARSGNINKNDASVWIGKKANEANWLHGVLDELVILNVAISEKEVQENMTGLRLAVAPLQKLTTTWGTIKRAR